eukprot:14993047-Alexandrium_andersonii.AAC.1
MLIPAAAVAATALLPSPPPLARPPYIRVRPCSSAGTVVGEVPIAPPTSAEAAAADAAASCA